MKREYIPPELQKKKITLTSAILSSTVENFSSYIDDGGDWDDPVPGDDPNINW